MNGKAVLENVRRYRMIASLYRQTAAFRPRQSSSLLGQALEWERLAVAELEAYFNLRDDPAAEARSRGTDARWEALATA
jgi:3-methyladenine DNA glycosylase Mpg